MKIISKQLENNQEQIKNENFIDYVLNTVLKITKNDKSFSTEKKIEHIENENNELKNKIKKNNVLLKQSLEMEKTISNKLKDIDEYNFNLKSRLLEILGTE